MITKNANTSCADPSSLSHLNEPSISKAPAPLILPEPQQGDNTAVVDQPARRTRAASMLAMLAARNSTSASPDSPPRGKVQWSEGVAIDEGETLATDKMNMVKSSDKVVELPPSQIVSPVALAFQTGGKEVSFSENFDKDNCTSSPPLAPLSPTTHMTGDLLVHPSVDGATVAPIGALEGINEVTYSPKSLAFLADQVIQVNNCFLNKNSVENLVGKDNVVDQLELPNRKNSDSQTSSSSIDTSKVTHVSGKADESYTALSLGPEYVTEGKSMVTNSPESPALIAEQVFMTSNRLGDPNTLDNHNGTAIQFGPQKCACLCGLVSEPLVNAAQSSELDDPTTILGTMIHA